MADYDAVLSQWSIWDSEGINFSVRFSDRRVPVRISREALEKLAGRSLPRLDDMKQAFSDHLDAVLHAAVRKAPCWKDFDPDRMSLGEADV